MGPTRNRLTARRGWRLPALAIALAAAFLAGVASHDEVAPWLRSRWREIRGPAAYQGYTRMRLPEGAGGPSESQRREMAALRGMAYLTGVQPAPDVVGVTAYAPERAQPGLNLVVDAHGPEAVLLDMEGRQLHRWSYEFFDAFPDSDVPKGSEGVQYWRRVALEPDGSLLAVFEGAGLVEVDRDSRLLWGFEEAVHHDLAVDGDSIYVLTREVRPGGEESGGRPVTEDWVVVLDRGGDVRRRVSIEQAIRASDYRGLLDLTESHGDLLHTNTLELLDGGPEERLPAFRRGNVLLSFPEINTMAVLDMDREVIVWALVGLTRYQHDPTVLPSGHLLVLDNWGDIDGYSRLLELDPSTGAITWRYEGSRYDFYTKCCGVNQRLANGDTLVAETDRGRAFEVTPDKQIVWEYLTPHRVGEEDELVARLFDVQRIDEAAVAGWLELGGTGTSAAPGSAPEGSSADGPAVR